MLNVLGSMYAPFYLAEFKRCHTCSTFRSRNREYNQIMAEEQRFTDIVCVVCCLWFCEGHLVHCVQCQQAVCEKCFENDECCSKPRGKTMEHLRTFYENKVVGGTGLNDLQNALFRTESTLQVTRFREDVIGSSLHYFIDSYDSSCLDGVGLETFAVIAKCFPWSKEKDMIEKTAAFLEFVLTTRPWLFCLIWYHSEDPDWVLSMMSNCFDRYEELWIFLVINSVSSEIGGKAFQCLRNRDFLCWDKFIENNGREKCANLEALKWIEMNGVNVTMGSRYWDFWSFASVEIVEFLITQRGLTLDELRKKKQHWFTLEMLKMLKRVLGVEAVRKITISDIWANLSCKVVLFLQRIGYEFDKEQILKTLDLGNISFALF